MKVISAISQKKTEPLIQGPVSVISIDLNPTILSQQQPLLLILFSWFGPRPLEHLVISIPALGLFIYELRLFLQPEFKLPKPLRVHEFWIFFNSFIFFVRLHHLYTCSARLHCGQHQASAFSCQSPSVSSQPPSVFFFFIINSFKAACSCVCSLQKWITRK